MQLGRQLVGIVTLETFQRPVSGSGGELTLRMLGSLSCPLLLREEQAILVFGCNLDKVWTTVLKAERMVLLEISCLQKPTGRYMVSDNFSHLDLSLSSACAKSCDRLLGSVVYCYLH